MEYECRKLTYLEIIEIFEYLKEHPDMKLEHVKFWFEPKFNTKISVDELCRIALLDYV